jgi:Rod binding domain-containing protein
MQTSAVQLGGQAGGAEWSASLGRARLPRGDDARASFASLLGQAETAGRAEPTGTPEDKARETARQFVAVTLVQPLLKQLRETNQAAAPFAPGQGERQFQSLLDADLALRITGAAQFPLVDALARRLTARDAGADDSTGRTR